MRDTVRASVALVSALFLLVWFVGTMALFAVTGALNFLLVSGLSWVWVVFWTLEYLRYS